MSIAQAFNEWMRRYTDDPKAFAAEFQTIGDFLAQKGEGKEPDYGSHCEAYLKKLMAGA